MGRTRRLGLAGIFAIALAVGTAAACGSVTAIDQSDASSPGAGTADRNSGSGHDPGGVGGAGGAPAAEVAMLPCMVCARADACCKAEGLGGCNYTAACASASTTDQQQLQIALCQAAIDPGGGKGGPHCAPRRGGDR